MSNNWVIGIPAWGQHYINTLLRVTLPSVAAALKEIGGGKHVRFIIVTDHNHIASIAEWLRRHVPLADVLYSPPSVRFFPGKPGKEKYAKLGDATRHIIEGMQIGELGTILMADVCVSRDWFTSAEKHLENKNLVVLGGGGRTCDGDPPIGVSAADLRRWAWDHRHPWIRQCTWGTGTSRAPTLLFFAKNGTVVCRGFHQHTHAAFRKIKNLGFTAITGDAGKGGFAESNFKRSEIAIVTTPDEMGFAEMTPREVAWPVGDKLSVEGMVAWSKNMTEWDWWLFEQRFHIVGDGDPGDREVCDEIRKRAVERQGTVT